MAEAGRARGVGPRGVGRLLGKRRQPLDGCHGVGRQRAATAARGGCRARGAQLRHLLPQVGEQRARLLGALALVADRADQGVQLGVRVRQVAGEHAVLLDPLAGERLHLDADAIQLQPETLVQLCLGACLGELGGEPLVAIALGRARGQSLRARPTRGPSRLELGAQVRGAGALGELALELLDARVRGLECLAQLGGRLGGAALELREPSAQLIQLLAGALVADARELARERLHALAHVGQRGVQRALVPGALARLGKRCLELLDAGTRVAQLRLEPVALVAGGPLLGELGVERVDLLARDAQLAKGGARLLELRAQVLLCLRRPGELALEPLGDLARLLDRRACALALLLGLGAHLLEHAACLGELRVELGDSGGCLRDLTARGLGLAAGLLELGGGALERAFQVLGAPQRGLDRVGDLPGPPPSLAGLVLRRERRRGQLDQRPEGDDRACGEVVLVEARLAAHGGVHPVDDGLVAALELLERVAARGRDLERLQEAVELEALAHPDGHERERELELRPVLAAGDGLRHAAELGELAGEGERLHERAPDHARARPAEHLLGGPAPARHGAVAIRQDEAGIDELAEQLLDGVRLGGRGTRLLLGHVSFSVGRRPRRHKPRAETFDLISLRTGPPVCNSVLESALDARVERVEAVEGERLGRAELPPRQRVRAVMGEDAVRDGVQLRLRERVEAPRALGHELLSERDVAHERAGLAQRDLRAELELERLAHVVEDRGREQQVRVEARVERACLERQRRHRHRVLEQPAEVRVVAGARTG